MDAAVTAAGAVVFDVSSGQLLYSKAGEERMYPASMTKLLDRRHRPALRRGGAHLHGGGRTGAGGRGTPARRQHPLQVENDLFLLLDGMCSLGNDAAQTVL